MKSVLDHPMRAHIKRVVEDEPGLCFSDLLRRLRSSEFSASVGNGVLDFHLYRLERAGLIASHKSGQYRRYYPVDGAWRPDAQAFAIVQSYDRWPLAVALAKSKGLTVREVRQRLATHDRDVPALWRQLRLLHASGLVSTERLGTRHRYHPTSRLVSAVRTLSRDSPETRQGDPATIPGPGPALACVGSVP